MCAVGGRPCSFFRCSSLRVSGSRGLDGPVLGFSLVVLGKERVMQHGLDVFVLAFFICFLEGGCQAH